MSAAGASAGGSARVDGWLRAVRRAAKPRLLRVRRWLASLLHPYAARELDAALADLGIAPGDTVMLHAGFLPTSGFRGTPAEVLACYRARLGAAGHLVMMSMPYRGASETYAAGGPLFDLLRTPSALGILSEVFRREPGVLRSASPLHPLLACGPLAPWLVADHEHLLASCGRGSPFERLLALDAWVVFHDAPYASMTFMHYVEDRCRARLPVDLYLPEPVGVRLRDGSGRERLVRHRVFAPEARARRRFESIEQALVAAAELRDRAVGGTRLRAVRARAVLARAEGLVAAGQGFYR